jgi:hypothetical protein
MGRRVCEATTMTKNPIKKTNKQRTFEETFENLLDFTAGDLLDHMYKDPETEARWKTWSACWDAINGRFHKQIDAVLASTSSTERRSSTTATIKGHK